MLIKNKEQKQYISILSSDASLRLVVPEGTPGAVVREYELKDKTKGKKTELVFNKISGKITDISFYDGDFGKLLQLDITDDAGTLTLSVSTAQNYAEDLMKKIPSLDLSKDMEITPYCFVDDKGKTRKGVSIVQDGVKVKSFFRDEEKKVNTNGFPSPSGDEKDSEDWKLYFMTARKFLVNYIEKNFPTKNGPKAVSTSDIASIYPTEEINPDSIPF